MGCGYSRLGGCVQGIKEMWENTLDDQGVFLYNKQSGDCLCSSQDRLG